MPPRNLDPNPAVANNLTGRGNNGTGALTQVTGLASPWLRPTASRATPNVGSATLTGARYAPGGDISGRIFTVLIQYSFANTPPADAGPYVACFNSSGTHIANLAAITVPAGTVGGTVVTAVMVGTAAANTTQLCGALYAGSTTAGGAATLGAIRIDEIDDPVMGYGDGASPGWTWNGTAGSSASSQASVGTFWPLMSASRGPGPPPLFRDAFTGASNGPLAGRTAQSGHTWSTFKDSNPSGGEVPVILNGAIGPPAGHVPGQGGGGAAAGYATVALDGKVSSIGARYLWDTSSATTSAVVLGAFTSASLPPSSSGNVHMHCVINATNLQFSVWVNGINNIEYLTPVGYGSSIVNHPSALIRDGATQYRTDLFIDQSASTVYINMQGLPTLVYVHPAIGNGTASFPIWEYYSVTNGSNLPRITSVWADRLG